MGDVEAILHECVTAQREGREISDACARVIGSLYHSGQGTIGYTFVSTGAIVGVADPDSSVELYRELFTDYQSLTPNEKLVADMLGTYLAERARTDRMGAVPGWSALWLGAPSVELRDTYTEVAHTVRGTVTGAAPMALESGRFLLPDTVSVRYTFRSHLFRWDTHPQVTGPWCDQVGELTGGPGRGCTLPWGPHVPEWLTRFVAEHEPKGNPIAPGVTSVSGAPADGSGGGREGRPEEGSV